MLPIRATPAGCHTRKDERADVTTDGQVSLSNGTLQRKRTGLRTRSHRNVCHTPKPVRAASSAGVAGLVDMHSCS